MSHITYIVTDPMTVKIYLKPQLEALVDRKWRVTVIYGGTKDSLPHPEELRGVRLYYIPLRREIAPVSDCVALAKLLRLLLQLRPTIVNAGTPKAGLIGMIASRLAGIPVRIYQLHGLRLETAAGWKRRLFSMTERTACWCSQTVLCVSNSLKKKVVELDLCESKKIAVLGSGSCAGVDVGNYTPTSERLAIASRLRQCLDIPSDGLIVGFVGRLTKDKGVAELLEAFSLVRQRACSAYLLLVGPFEKGDPIPEHTRLSILTSPYIRHIDWTDDPRPYLHMMHVLVLPTYREGLPGVLLEAAAAQTPVVATSATGVIDVISDGETGLLSAPGDVRGLAENILKVLLNPALSSELGRRALRKIEAEFARDQVLQLLDAFYRDSARSVWRPSPVTG